MKNINIYLIIGAFAFFSCNDEEKLPLTVSTDEITLDAAGHEQHFTVTTDEAIWRVVCDATWPMIERDSLGTVTVSAADNPSRAVRTAKLYIAAGDQFQRINLSQEGSLRVLGDPYPDAANPVGIIYKVSDGGQHGMVISLDQAQCTWGLATATQGAGDFRDGSANTRSVVSAHKDDATFSTDFPAFFWVYQKNNGNADGEWYIPSYFELLEFYNLAVGNTYSIPATGNPSSSQVTITHNAAVREAFNASVEALGGTPVTFDKGMHWTSSESSAAQALTVQFFFSGANYQYYMTGQNKSFGSFFVRAILKF
ncbi:MAG: BACON domain-containing protein [Dysgonamonadaceae bacterium]|jgi:hypothetical protein|nr:BACON domain-containing protein [Dysgonamonadaceae bacterium]